jgi:methionine--tRNA ligase beta chain
MISIGDFKNLELRAGEVLAAERVEGSEKLLKLSVNLGEETPRQILAGIAAQYPPEALVGKQIAVVANLEPRAIMGMESQGMLLAAEGKEGPALLVPDRNVTPGAKIH